MLFHFREFHIRKKIFRGQQQNKRADQELVSSDFFLRTRHRSNIYVHNGNLNPHSFPLFVGIVMQWRPNHISDFLNMR